MNIVNMEKSPAYNYNGGTTTAGMDTGVTGTSSSFPHGPAQQAPAYNDTTGTTTTTAKYHNANNDYYPPSSAGIASAPTAHPVGTGAGLDHTNRDSMATTAVAAPTPTARSSRTSSFTGSDVILLIMAIFLPPVAVFLKRGCDAHFFINILLTILAWLPGMIHAFYVVVRYPGDLGDRRDRKYEAKRGL